jgi:hypothetical protein
MIDAKTWTSTRISDKNTVWPTQGYSDFADRSLGLTRDAGGYFSKQLLID